jgi:hypothetical protein
MKRLYIRNKNGWVPIGWYCQNCGSVALDELTKKESFHTILGPKIAIMRIRNT